jgi:hypothetical protein
MNERSIHVLPTSVKLICYRQRALGLLIQETYVAQSYQWGGEAQVDWYEAYAELAGDLTKLQVFCMRSMASGGAFHRAYRPASLSGRPRTGLPALWRRLQAAALRQSHQCGVLRGRLREETERFIALRSHWHFEFCTPGAGHEKGGVEGENGYFRRNHWVPVPKAASLEVLNDLLLMRCREDEGRLIDGRTQRVGQAMAEERDHLLALPVEGFDLAEISFPIVDGGGCVRTNAYSTPVRPGTTVQVKVYPAHLNRVQFETHGSVCPIVTLIKGRNYDFQTGRGLEVWHDGRCVARHERCYSRRQQILDLEHYLDVLERKPGALAGSTALEQWRRAGRWPASFDVLWQRLIDRQGRQHGTRAMIAVIQLAREFGHDAVRQAVDAAVKLGCSDSAAIRYLLTCAGQQRPAPEMAAG